MKKKLEIEPRLRAFLKQKRHLVPSGINLKLNSYEASNR